MLKLGYSLRGKRSIEKGTSALPARGNRIKSYHEINRIRVFLKASVFYDPTKDIRHQTSSDQTSDMVVFPIFAPMPEIRVKIINKSSNPLPAYATTGSAGMDIMAHIEAPVILQSLERYLIPTGLFIELPEGYEAQVRPRSGLAVKHGLTCLNSPGTIDADYRGEIKIILVNLSKDSHTIQPGDRIAQMIIGRVEQVGWELVSVIGETARSHGGFGHTGK